VETGDARSVIQLAGVQMTLAPDSSARVYRDRIVLEKGIGTVQEGSQHVIEAATMRIIPSTQDSVVQIEIADLSRVTVYARAGEAEVSNSAGILTARVRPGMALAFAPKAAPVSTVKMTGVVEARNGAYFLTDETTKVTVQVESKNASKYVGKRVEINGSPVAGAKPAGGASQVVRVETITRVADAARQGGDVAAAGGRGGAAGTPGATAGGAGSTGISAAAVGAIVGGAVIAGTVGGFAAAGTFSGSSVSRP
jgi:hypothetical protein